MYRCEVIANQSVQDELITLLEEHIEGLHNLSGLILLRRCLS